MVKILRLNGWEISSLIIGPIYLHHGLLLTQGTQLTAHIYYSSYGWVWSDGGGPGRLVHQQSVPVPGWYFIYLQLQLPSECAHAHAHAHVDTVGSTYEMGGPTLGHGLSHVLNLSWQATVGGGLLNSAEGGQCI